MYLKCTSCRILHHCLWDSLSRTLLEGLVEHSLVATYEPKEFIFHERDEAHGLYVLCQGLVKLIKSAQNNKQIIVALIHPGQLLGVTFALNGGLFPMSAQAVDLSTVLFLHRKHFDDLLQRDPSLSLLLLSYSNEQLGQTLNTLIDLVALDVEQRLAGALLQFAESAANHTNSGFVCRLPLRRAELADYIGTTPETTMRALGKLKRENILKIERRMITFLDMQRLRDLAHSA